MKLYLISPLFLWISCMFHLQAQVTCQKVGWASYYHDKFEGRRTSSGGKFHQRELTCAHRTLPFGTILRVTNLSNNKTVVVEVNDRGPYKKGRIIDLTRAAAKQLDFIRDGHVKVEIEVLADTLHSGVAAADSMKHYPLIDLGDTTLNGFAVHVGNFSDTENLDRMIERVKRELDRQLYIGLKNEDGRQNYQVLVGRFSDRGEAFGYLDQIIPYYPGAFIVALR